MALSVAWRERVEGWPEWAVSKLEVILARAGAEGLFEDQVEGWWRSTRPSEPQQVGVVLKVDGEHRFLTV